MALHINDDNFKELLNGEKPLVIDFWATWCGPCKAIAPYIDELAEEYKDKVIVGKVDIEESPEVTAKYGIRNIPTVLFVKNGEVVDKQVGACKKSDLAAKIAPLC